MPETDVARPVVAYLAAAGWDVHQEVPTPNGRADIVAVQDDRLWIVECKLSLTFDLLAQADAQKWNAHYVSVAVPATEKRSAGRALAKDWLRANGIGLLEVRTGRSRLGLTVEEPFVREVVAPAVTMGARADQRHLHALYGRPPLRVTRVKAIQRVRAFLCDETRTFAEAGNANGQYWSHKKAIVQAIQAATQEPRTAKEISAWLAAHRPVQLLTPRQVYSWLYNKWVPGVERVEGRPLKFRRST